MGGRIPCRLEGVGELLAAIEDGDAYFLCYDANGNVTELVDTNGASVAHYEYDAYGNVIVQSGLASTNNPFRFSTKYLGEETGWYYYGYRYYSPELGRWTRRDPIEEQGFLWTLREMVRARADEASCGILTGPTMSEERERLIRPVDSLYAFCRNAPVVNVDSDGRSIIRIILCLWKINKWRKHCLENVPKCDKPCMSDWEYTQCLQSQKKAIAECLAKARKMLEACLRGVATPPVSPPRM